MFDYKDMKATITPRSEFKYWFKSNPYNTKNWDVFGPDPKSKKKEPEVVHIATVEQNIPLEGQELKTFLTGFKDLSDDVCNAIEADFVKFKESRPEYWANKSINIDLKNIEENAKTYDTIFAATMLIRADTDEAIPQIEKCLRWLHGTDFYAAPASTWYHDSVDGGLVAHTLRVIVRMRDLLNTLAFSMISWEDGIIIALVHDWCKIYLYEKYLKNVEVEPKKWEKQPAFKIRDRSTIPLEFLVHSAMGHGAASLSIARQFIRLTNEQSLAIRWHMATWQVCDAEMNQLQEANENFPLVHLLQFSDQLSIVNY
jgi:hypothetical protein